jgi:ribosomal protein S18 acetylase RimI-like enzyme
MDDSRVRVRQATALDEVFVLDLAKRFGEGDLPRGRTSADVAAGTRRFLEGVLGRTRDADLFVVAETRDGYALGFLYAHERLDFFSGEPVGHVSEIAVAAGAEGTGAAETLMRAAERWAIARGYARLSLNVFVGNARARRFYERLGFEPETLAYGKDLRGA